MEMLSSMVPATLMVLWRQPGSEHRRPSHTGSPPLRSYARVCAPRGNIQGGRLACEVAKNNAETRPRLMPAQHLSGGAPFRGGRIFSARPLSAASVRSLDMKPLGLRAALVSENTLEVSARSRGLSTGKTSGRGWLALPIGSDYEAVGPV